MRVIIRNRKVQKVTGLFPIVDKAFDRRNMENNSG
jgi:hypothetical protein